MVWCYLLSQDRRAFYSMMACAFIHSVFELVEHRWTHGQYFGPPSTDGAWAEHYRAMLIQEREDGTLRLFAATPRRWLEDGKTIEIERAPTYYGKLSARVESRVDAGAIIANVEFAGPDRPAALTIRLRHPQARPMRAVTVDGSAWTDFDARDESVRIASPAPGRRAVEVAY